MGRHEADSIEERRKRHSFQNGVSAFNLECVPRLHISGQLLHYIVDSQSLYPSSFVGDDGTRENLVIGNINIVPIMRGRDAFGCHISLHDGLDIRQRVERRQAVKGYSKDIHGWQAFTHSFSTSSNRGIVASCGFHISDAIISLRFLYSSSCRASCFSLISSSIFSVW
jgi:hypothetical protein